MDVRYDGQSAIVTGGASGMGAALARLLVESGCRITIADIDDPAGTKLALELGESARFVCTDITRFEQCVALVDSAVSAFGQIDVLFNNAGRGELFDTDTIAMEDWDRLIDLNLNGAFRMTKAALPHLKSAGKGAIVNTCSVSGLAGDYGMIAYNTAKGGLINMTRCLALDLSRYNIRVNAVCPGIITDTAQASPLASGPGGLALWNARIPMNRTGRAVEVARVMAFIGSDLASYMSGSVVVVDGGLLAHTGMPTPGDFAAAAVVA